MKKILLLLAAVGLSRVLPGAEGSTTYPGGNAPEWPMFHGSPGLLGVASGSLEAKLALLWTFKAGGPVKSSAALVERRVFIGSSDNRLYCLEADSGKKVWDFKTEGEVESSPLVREGRVFAGSADGALYALNAADGKLLWKYPTGDKILGSPNWVRGPRAGSTWVLIGSYDYRLHCVDAVTGTSNWVYESGNYINGTPAVAAGVTVFGGCDAILHVLALADGHEQKQIPGGAYIAGSAALLDQRAYFGHMENEVWCVDLAKGTNVWVYRDRAFPYFSSPAVTQDRVLIGGRDKRLHCLNRADGTPVWRFATRGKVDSSPAVCGDKVVVGSDDGRLYLVSLADGHELWSYEIGPAVGSSPAVAGGRIVVGSEDGGVYCFGPPGARKAE